MKQFLVLLTFACTCVVHGAEQKEDILRMTGSSILKARQPDLGYPLVVKTTDDKNECLLVGIRPQMSIRDIKQKINEEYGYPPLCQQLKYQETDLQDNTLFQAYLAQGNDHTITFSMVLKNFTVTVNRCLDEPPLVITNFPCNASIGQLEGAITNADNRLSDFRYHDRRLDNPAAGCSECFIKHDGALDFEPYLYATLSTTNTIDLTITLTNRPIKRSVTDDSIDLSENEEEKTERASPPPTINLRLAPNCTVLNIKQEIERLYGRTACEIARQKLTLGQTRLENTRPYSDYLDYENPHNLQLTLLEVQDTFTLLVKTLSTEIVQLEGITEETPIWMIKTRIAAEKAWPVERQRLIYRAQELQDDKVYWQYAGQERGHAFHLVLRPDNTQPRWPEDNEQEPLFIEDFVPNNTQWSSQKKTIILSGVGGVVVVFWGIGKLRKKLRRDLLQKSPKV